MKAILVTLVLMAVTGFVWLTLEERHGDDEQVLLNVSYDPTRELWHELNDKFQDQYFKTTARS